MLRHVSILSNGGVKELRFVTLVRLCSAVIVHNYAVVGKLGPTTSSVTLTP